MKIRIKIDELGGIIMNIENSKIERIPSNVREKRRQEEKRQKIAEEIVEIYKSNQLSLLEIELIAETVKRIIRCQLHM